MASMYGDTPGFDDLINQWSGQAPGGGIIPQPGNISSPWKSFLNFINAPIAGQAGDDQNLMSYKPVSRIGALGEILSGAAKGVLSARGPYSNPLGMGLVGAGQGADQAKQEDLTRRQNAVNDQYKKIAAVLQYAQAQAALAKARNEGMHALSPGQVLTDASGARVATGGPQMGSANGYVYSSDPATGAITPKAHFPDQPNSIEGLAVNSLTGGQQPQLYGGGGAPGTPGGGAFGQQNTPSPQTVIGLLQQMTMLKQPLMNVNYRQAQAESAYSTDMGHQAAEVYKNYTTAGDVAQKALDNNKLLRGLAANIDTGPQAQTKLQLQQIASRFGLPDGTFTNMTGGQAFNAISGKAVLDAAGGHFSQGFSDADRGFAQSLAANLGNTPKANTILLDASDAVNNRIVQMKKEAVTWERDHRSQGGLYGLNNKGETFDMYMQGWAQQHPVFTPEWLKAHGIGTDPTGNPVAPAPDNGTGAY